MACGSQGPARRPAAACRQPPLTVAGDGIALRDLRALRCRQHGLLHVLRRERDRQGCCRALGSRRPACGHSPAHLGVAIGRLHRQLEGAELGGDGGDLLGWVPAPGSHQARLLHVPLALGGLDCPMGMRAARGMNVQCKGRGEQPTRHAVLHCQHDGRSHKHHATGLSARAPRSLTPSQPLWRCQELRSGLVALAHGSMASCTALRPAAQVFGSARSSMARGTVIQAVQRVAAPAAARSSLVVEGERSGAPLSFSRRPGAAMPRANSARGWPWLPAGRRVPAAA